ncbi:MAG: GNAT family N-acetyltransferase [Oscillospiraceae bacterium]
MKMLTENNLKVCSENTLLKTEVVQFRKITEVNGTAEHILCVREYSNSLICITCEVIYNIFQAVSSIDFKLYKLDNGGDISQNCIGKAACEIKNDCMKLCDIGIDTQYQGKGYGSVLMNEVVNYAMKLHIRKIKGEISQYDIDSSDKRKRLYHYYEKNGFFIDEEKKIVYLYIKNTTV